MSAKLIEAAKFFAYDMIIPDVLELLGRGGYAVHSDYHMVYESHRVTYDQRDSTLRILERQMRSIANGTLCNAKSHAAGKRWHPLLKAILDATEAEGLMEALMGWAIEAPMLHTRFLFRLYEELFERKISQEFPSTRQWPPHFPESYQGDMEREWEAGLPEDPQVLQAIADRRGFCERYWLPYLSKHETLLNAVKEELSARSGAKDTAAYQDLVLSLGLNPFARFDGQKITFDFLVHQPMDWQLWGGWHQEMTDAALLEDAKNFSYDMIMPDVLEQLGRDGYIMNLPLRNVCNLYSMTHAKRDVVLQLLLNQLRSMTVNNFTSPASKQKALCLHPLLEAILAAPDINSLMPAMMAWAIEDPRTHARFLFRLYRDLFESKKSQEFPSTRVTPPDFRYGSLGDYDEEQHRDAMWLQELPHDAQTLQTIARRRHFCEFVWAPYASQHDPVRQAVAEELKSQGTAKDTLAYQDLFMAMGFNPAAHLGTEKISYDFSL